MRSPVYPDTEMELKEIEPGLQAFECPKSGGRWLPLQNYLEWAREQPRTASTASTAEMPMLEGDSKQRALICPESGRLLLRYRVGHGLPFHIDRSPATGGTWLDKGEWEALKSSGLHLGLQLVFTSAYQRLVRSREYEENLASTFKSRIGEADFGRVTQFRDWLLQHPKRRDICCYLLEVASENGANIPQT